MTKYIVHGGKPLFGEVEISGAKNAAVAIIPAAILVDGVCRIENIPQISDVTAILKILEQLGASIRSINRHTVEIDSRHIHTTRTSYELSRKLRASYYLIGALLGRFGRAEVAMPGGCNFGGVRPIDQHVKGFSALGAGVTTEGGYINAIVESGRLTGANIYLDVVSVGATMNIMMAAALAQGDTVIENCAKEPHIVDLANFLNSMGADIRGAGTDTIKIRGVERLSGGSYAIIPDQIEAGTYMAAVAATGGQILVKNIIPKHMDCITAKLQECGVEVEEQDDTLLVRRTARLKKANVKTLPYPGFPTDMQPQMTTVLTLAQGTSLVTEGVWSSRYRYVDELKRMGARIQVDDKTAVVEGVEKLTGAPIQAYDLRAGAALVIAALAAEGESEISNVQYIERGYEDIIGKLRALGADIRAVEEPDEDALSTAQISGTSRPSGSVSALTGPFPGGRFSKERYFLDHRTYACQRLLWKRRCALLRRHPSADRRRDLLPPDHCSSERTGTDSGRPDGYSDHPHPFRPSLRAEHPSEKNNLPASCHPPDLPGAQLPGRGDRPPAHGTGQPHHLGRDRYAAHPHLP